LLGKLGGGGLLDDVLGAQPTNVSRRNDVLGEIFGSKDVSRTVAQSASQSTGLSPDLLKKMLPMVAMALAGYMAKQKASGGAASQPAAPGGEPATRGGLGGLLGGSKPSEGARSGGLSSMLDMDGNGNPLDDIMRMVGKARPLTAVGAARAANATRAAPNAHRFSTLNATRRSRSRPAVPLETKGDQRGP
jgi:hypothetical protein